MGLSQPDLDWLFNLIPVPKLEDRHRQRLEQAISTEVVSQVIKNLKELFHPRPRWVLRPLL